MRIVSISDTHERHEQIAVPDGDLLICAGDVSESLTGLHRFLIWLERQPYQHKILVAGNHDFAFERQPELARAALAQLAPSVTYLQDSGTVVNGFKVWGSPWQPRFFDWAFNLNRGSELAAKWAMIPDDTDILVTHSPPFWTLDLIPSGMHVGCEDLAARLEQLQVRFHAFGHIHDSAGAYMSGLRTSVNASICDEAYKPTRKPIVMDL